MFKRVGVDASIPVAVTCIWGKSRGECPLINDRQNTTCTGTVVPVPVGRVSSLDLATYYQSRSSSSTCRPTVDLHTGTRTRM